MYIVDAVDGDEGQALDSGVPYQGSVLVEGEGLGDPAFIEVPGDGSFHVGRPAGVRHLDQGVPVGLGEQHCYAWSSDVLTKQAEWLFAMVSPGPNGAWVPLLLWESGQFAVARPPSLV